MAGQEVTCQKIVNVGEILSCVWCKGNFKTPLVYFECFHHSCKKCLEEKIGTLKPRSTFQCPACDTNLEIPLDRLFQSAPLQRLVSDITRCIANGENLCAICMKKTSANGKLCITCNMQLCKYDASCHTMALPDHHIFSYAELKKQPRLYTILDTKIMCNEHSLEIGKVCQQCSIPSCTACPAHDGHVQVSIEDMAVGHRQKIEQQIILIKQAETLAKSHVKEYQTLPSKVDKNCKIFLQELNMQKRSENFIFRYDSLVQKMTIHAQTLKDEIKNRLKVKESKVRRYERARAYLRYFNKLATDTEIVQYGASILNHSNDCIANQGDIDITIPKYSVQFFEDLEKKQEASKELTLINCKLEKQWDSEWWTGVTVSRGDVILVKGKRITVVTLEGKEKGDILCDDLNEAWDVDIHGEQLYISDTYPKKREVLILDWGGAVIKKISLPDEEKLFDSPLGIVVDKQDGTVFISSAASNAVYRYTEEDKIKKFITEYLNYPWYLCVTPNNELVVSNIGSHTVSVFDKTGNLLWQYGGKGSGKCKLDWPLGVCSDQWGQIYIADLENNRLHYISGKGKFRRYIDIKQEIRRPWAITLHNQKLIVTTQSVFKTQPIFVINCKYEK